MTDRLYPMPIDDLLRWILAERDSLNQWFGVHEDHLFVPKQTDPFRLYRYDQLLENPIGVAAGPHTQLTQNILISWLMGARYLELKTVQTLDAIEVAKPCIDMQRDGYNCEWSQELTLEQSAEEYVKAWVLLHLVKKLRGMDESEPGFIFNLSIGYDLAGIQNPNMQRFLDTMDDATDLIQQNLSAIADIVPEAKDLVIPAKLSDNVTLSTMHGCPPDEIERIASYLIEQRHYHTAVKLNPTLLGPERLREILANRGYNRIDVPDQAFEHDLKYDDALEIIQSLRILANREGVEFGLKLTNTLEVRNKLKALPEDQEQLYLSGEALHPLAVNVADQLQEDFNGELDLTFSGGADAFNTPSLISAGLAPVTICTDLLRPGGYLRLAQYISLLCDKCTASNAESLSELATAGPGGSERENLRLYAQQVSAPLGEEAAHKPSLSMKTSRKLPRFDCASAPCVQSCAIEQAIPEYLYWAETGDLDSAWRTVLHTNPLPRITGMVCDHLCMARCTRVHYDDPILIRDVKRYIAEAAIDRPAPSPAGSNGFKVAIIGAGPAGLSAAWTLAMAGSEVNVYETQATVGGMAGNAIPSFRIDEQDLEADLDRIRQAGARFHFNVNIDSAKFDQLRVENEAVFVAVGAVLPRKLRLPNEDSPGVWNQLDFLDKTHDGSRVELGKNVLIIGGGFSAVDAARTAKRLVGPGGRVTMLYRRTRAEMPAGPAETTVMLGEGIELHELTAPERLVINDGQFAGLVCKRMKLGTPDASGRPRPESIEGSEFEIAADTMITALGQQVLFDFLPDGDLQVNPDSFDTNLENVYAGGDAIRGASTLIRAVEDGIKAAEQMLSTRKITPFDTGFDQVPEWSLSEIQRRQSLRIPAASLPETNDSLNFNLEHPALSDEAAAHEGERCLQCSAICNICVAVCPNRANIALPTTDRNVPTWELVFKGAKASLIETGKLETKQPFQILNIADFCNECGDCTSFCPSGDRPWADKPRIALSADAANGESNVYLLTDNGLTGRGARFDVQNDTASFAADGLEVQLSWPDLVVTNVSFKGDTQSPDLSVLTEIIMVHLLLDKSYLRTVSAGAVQ
jgi:putative selenate reductase